MVLMYENKPVCEVNLVGGVPSSFGNIYEKNLLPFGTRAKFKAQEPMLTREWVKSRSVPSVRQGKDRIEKVLGASVSDAFLKSLAVSLTDKYWVKEEGSSLRWEDVNYWDNGFSPVFALAIDGVKSVGISPDFTTDGVMDKFWYLSGGYPYLAKTEYGGEKGTGLLQVANEVVCSEIAKAIGVSVTPYFYGEFNGLKTCDCPCFVSGKEEEFVNMLQIRHEHIGEPLFDLVNYVEKDLGLKKQLDEVRVLDVLLGQKDRHERNIGLIVKNHDLSSSKLAPSFDNGSCLMFDKAKGVDDLKFFKKRREFVARDITDIPELDYRELSHILKKTYEEYGVRKESLVLALNEMTEGFNVLEEARREKELNNEKEL